MDTIKSKIKEEDKNKEEYTFKPKISKNSKKIKRSIDDLYNWKKAKEKKIEEKQREKKKLEDEQFELNQQTSFINSKSKILLSRKSKDSSKQNYNINEFDNYENEEENNEEGEYINDNNNEIKFDLWPNYLEKKFYDEKEELPLKGIKEEEYNHLDFLENKKEYNESEDENNNNDGSENENEGD